MNPACEPWLQSRGAWLVMAAAAVLLAAVWLLGGVVSDSSWHDEGLQLLALPVLLVAVASLLSAPPNGRLARIALAVMLAGFAVVALQLLPMPAGLWSASPPRAEFQRDLAAAGVIGVEHRWTLTPYGTEHALWRLLPPLAAFLCGLVLAPRHRRALLSFLLLLAAANVGLALQQASLPQVSPLRLYRVLDGVPMFGGVFINENHHATALVMAMVLALCLAVDAWRRRLPVTPWRLARLAGSVLLGLVCAVAIPMTHSRAGSALLLPSLIACALLAGLIPTRWIWRRRANLGLALGVLAAFVAIALGLLAVVKGQDPRFIIADATFSKGWDYLPWGSGAGSFTPVFETELPKALWIPNYVNHAHNEYAQWWLVGGLPAVLVVAAGLALLAIAGVRLLRLRGRRSAALLASGCWVAVAAALVHSWVDFPLGTTTLATTVALLAGVLFSCLDELEANGEYQRALERTRLGSKGNRGAEPASSLR